MKFRIYDLLDYVNQNKANRCRSDWELDEVIKTPDGEYDGIGFNWIHMPVGWKNGVEISLMFNGESTYSHGTNLFESDDALLNSRVYTNGFVTLNRVILLDDDGHEIAPSIFEDWLDMYYEGDFWDELYEVYRAKQNDDYEEPIKQLMQGIRDSNKP